MTGLHSALLTFVPPFSMPIPIFLCVFLLQGYLRWTFAIAICYLVVVCCGARPGHYVTLGFLAHVYAYGTLMS
jgi:hypothetical protein